MYQERWAPGALLPQAPGTPVRPMPAARHQVKRAVTAAAVLNGRFWSDGAFSATIKRLEMSPRSAEGSPSPPLRSAAPATCSVDQDADELFFLFPDLEKRHLAAFTDELASALRQDPNAVALRLIGLKSLFPGVDLWGMVLHAPWLLFEPPVEFIAARMDALREERPARDPVKYLRNDPCRLFGADGFEAAKTAILLRTIKRTDLRNLRGFKWSDPWVKKMLIVHPMLVRELHLFSRLPRGEDGERAVIRGEDLDLTSIFIEKIADALPCLRDHPRRAAAELTAHSVAGVTQADVAVDRVVNLPRLAAIVVHAAVEQLDAGEAAAVGRGGDVVAVLLTAMAEACGVEPEVLAKESKFLKDRSLF